MDGKQLGGRSLQGFLPLLAIVALAVSVVMPASVASAASPSGANGVIAFLRDGDIWTVNPDGTGETQLTELGTVSGQFSWSPDGTRIVFSASPDCPPVLGEWCGPQDLFLVDIVTSETTQLTFTRDVGEAEPAWSPDGNRIAYSAGVFDDNGATLFVDSAAIHVLSLITGGVADVTQLGVVPGPNVHFHNPGWSPNGQWVSFYAEFYLWTGPLYSVLPSEGGPPWYDRELWPTCGGVTLAPDWSFDGEKLVIGVAGYWHEPPGSVLCVVDSSDFTTHELRFYEWDVGFPEDIIIDSPRWSPVDNRIAFAHLRQNPDQSYTWSIRTILSNGSQEVEVVSDTSSPGGPTGGDPMWSPDGSMIAFRGSSGLEVVSADGADEPRHVATLDGRNVQAIWQPIKDTVSIRIVGGLTYTLDSPLTLGNYRVNRDSGGIVSVAGTGTVVGTNGIPASVLFSVQRLWIFPTYFGTIRVVDPAAGLSLNHTVFFGSARPDGLDGAKGSSGWIDTSSWPWQGYTVAWAVRDLAP